MKGHRPEGAFAGALRRVAARNEDASPALEHRRAKGERSPREPTLREDRRPERPRAERSEPVPEELGAFRAMPVLQPPVEVGAAAPGSGLERAQAAAMAERLLHTVRVGEVAGGHEVRLGLAGSRVEVRLRQEGDRLVPELHLGEGATGSDAATAERLAPRLDAELARAGLDFEPIAILH